MSKETRPTQAIKGAPGLAGLGERLKCVRLMRGLTKKQLVKQAEHGYASLVVLWENGRCYPSLSELRSLCKALNVSADYLLDTNDV